MKVKEIITLLEEFAPLAYAEDFDNTGLLVGDQEAKVTGILVTMDTLEAVVEEAIEKIAKLEPILGPTSIGHFNLYRSASIQGKQQQVIHPAKR